MEWLLRKLLESEVTNRIVCDVDDNLTFVRYEDKGYKSLIKDVNTWPLHVLRILSK